MWRTNYSDLLKNICSPKLASLFLWIQRNSNFPYVWGLILFFPPTLNVPWLIVSFKDMTIQESPADFAWDFYALRYFNQNIEKPMKILSFFQPSLTDFSLMPSAIWREMKKQGQRKDTIKSMCRSVLPSSSALAISHGSGPVRYSWRAKLILSPPGSAWINATMKSGTFSFQIPLKKVKILCHHGDQNWSCSVAKLSAFAFSSQLQVSHPGAKWQGRNQKQIGQENPKADS